MAEHSGRSRWTDWMCTWGSGELVAYSGRMFWSLTCRTTIDGGGRAVSQENCLSECLHPSSGLIWPQFNPIRLNTICLLNILHFFLSLHTSYTLPLFTALSLLFLNILILLLSAQARLWLLVPALPLIWFWNKNYKLVIYFLSHLFYSLRQYFLFDFGLVCKTFFSQTFPWLSISVFQVRFLSKKWIRIAAN